jgi:hypothetical protein
VEKWWLGGYGCEVYDVARGGEWKNVKKILNVDIGGQ